MSKSILIVTYSYSTKEGVGSRRWIKFSHSLANMGYNVSVLCSSSKFDDNEKHLSINYYLFRSNYNKTLEQSPISLMDKINYRIALLLRKIKTKGSPYDKASLDEKTIVDTSIKIILDNNIKNVIVSGAPFSLLYFGTKIKQKIQSINLISDLRDPWTWGHIYGMANLSRLRKDYENEMEKAFINKSDIVFSASDDITYFLKEKYSDAKIITLLNGIEHNSQFSPLNYSNKEFIVTHIGTINMGTSKYWTMFLESILETNIDIKVFFIGLKNPQVIEYINNFKSDKIEIIPRIKESDLAPYIRSSSAFLMFKKDGFENSYPSKFFDYIKARKPIIAFTKKGVVSEEIINKNIGFVFNNNSTKKDILRAFELIYQNQFEYNYTYDWHKFSIEYLTSIVEEHLV